MHRWRDRTEGLIRESLGVDEAERFNPKLGFAIVNPDPHEGLRLELARYEQKLITLLIEIEEHPEEFSKRRGGKTGIKKGRKSGRRSGSLKLKWKEWQRDQIFWWKLAVGIMVLQLLVGFLAVVKRFHY
ncbi:MAG: hypothetical protein PVH29_07085 [Candidatus Zixiibacteriota bacterium]